MDVQANPGLGCAAVQEHLNTPIPKTLWHYTTFAALEGIIRERAIRATEYRYLNDREEFVHAKKLAYELIEDLPEFTDKKCPVRELTRKGVDTVLDTGSPDEELHIMVASFSEATDQLSQWRGYAGNASGVSIGFDLSAIRPTNPHTAATFAPCIYDDFEKRSKLTAIFEAYRSVIEPWWNLFVKHIDSGVEDEAGGPVAAAGIFEESSIGNDKWPHTSVNDVLRRYRHQFICDLIRIAPLLKNKSFSEEREWRLVVPLDQRGSPVGDGLDIPPLQSCAPTELEIKFNPTQNALRPYIAHRLAEGPAGSVPCNDLILGPGCHPSAEAGVNMFLRHQGIQALARHSAIPYRPG